MKSLKPKRRKDSNGYCLRCLQDVDVDVVAYVGEGDGAFEYVPIGGNKETTKVYGSAGDLFLFDADVLEHRATPPINKPRIALDLIILAQPANLSNVVTSVPGTGWPVDPYQFELSSHAITSNHDRRWFSEYPKIIAKNSNMSA